jgi:small subunit ribosomal protein S21
VRTECSRLFIITQFAREAIGEDSSPKLFVHAQEDDNMTQVVIGENEGIESALRRFKRQVSKAGIFADMKRLRHFETPIEKKKRKAVARRRKRRIR